MANTQVSLAQAFFVRFVKTTDEFQEVSNDREIVFEVLAVFASRESVELKGAMTKSAS